MLFLGGKMIHLMFSKNQPGSCSWFLTLNLWWLQPMCVCVCIWMCVYVWMYVCVYMQVYICVKVWTCTCGHMCVCFGCDCNNYACVYLWVLCMCVYACVCVCLLSLGTAGKPSLRSWHFEWRGSHTKTHYQNFWAGECNIFKEYNEGYVARPCCSRCGQGRWDQSSRQALIT